MDSSVDDHFLSTAGPLHRGFAPTSVDAVVSSQGNEIVLKIAISNILVT